MFYLSRDPRLPPLPFSCWMEQEDHQGVHEHQNSEDRDMGSDFENSEDREGDPEERAMGSNPQDTEERGHLEQEMNSNPQDDDLRGDSHEREIVSTVCPGEKTGVSMEVATFTFGSSGIQPGPASQGSGMWGVGWGSL